MSSLDGKVSEKGCVIAVSVEVFITLGCEDIWSYSMEEHYFVLSSDPSVI